MLALALAVGTAACSQADSPTEAAHASTIAWREGDVDDALAEAKELGKPVILYWGAVWCPPCNQMKATLFKDPASSPRPRSSCRLSRRRHRRGRRNGRAFGISGYPTVIILTPTAPRSPHLERDDGERAAGAARDCGQRTTSIEAAAGEGQRTTPAA
jgi:protein disulfide-isomerase